MALAWTRLALGTAAAERYGASVDERWPAVVALMDQPATPQTTSAGRLFDAAAALLGLRPRVTYEAQAAIELEACASRVGLHDVVGYPVEFGEQDGLLVLDPSPLIARLVAERDAGTAIPLISAGFHAGLGQSTARAAGDLAAREGLATVALSGGVFQNSRLTEIVVGHLEHEGLEVLVHHRVPPNDGGISVGQAAIAAAHGSRPR